MNILWLFLAVFFSSFVQDSCAYGERGIAERAAYYVAYLAEEQMYKLDKTTKMTIAPGCVGSLPVEGLGDRCNLDELMLYIWAPDPDNKATKKPEGYRELKGKKFEKTGISELSNLNAKQAFNKLIGKLENARFDTGESLDGEIDVSKLMPGKSDFYDALSSIGDPIGALAAEVDKREKGHEPNESPTFQVSEEQENAIKWGRETAYYVSALRGKDQDKYRRLFFKKEFGKEFEIETMRVDTPKEDKTRKPESAGKKGNPTFEWKPQTLTMIDFDATVQKYKDNIEGFEEKLSDANNKFMELEKRRTGRRRSSTLHIRKRTPRPRWR